MFKIAICGFGPRGLSIFERLVSKKLNGSINQKIHIIIFEPSNILGAGCHTTKQNPNLLVNTIASQMTIFADETICKNEFFIKGPSFYDFLLQNRYRVEKNGYYSRVLLGQYLNESYKFIKSFCSNDIALEHICDEVVELSRENDTFYIKTTKNSYKSNAVFITTGHGVSSNDKYVSLCNSLQKFNHKNIIAIKGLGLSAIDMITILTTGNGGSFQYNKKEVIYSPSGIEPKILAFSRSNLPLMARAITQKEIREQYQPVFFTKQAICDLKIIKKYLNFRADILPLIIKEMEYVYTYTFLNLESKIKSFHFRNEYILTKNTKNVIDKYIPKDCQFNYLKLLYPINNATSADDFKCKLVAFLEEDIKEAIHGNLTSPLKAACDILRDTRDILRFCIDFNGLDSDSYDFLENSFLSFNNRICVGPPLIKMQELLALIKSNVVEIIYDANIINNNTSSIKIVDKFNNKYSADVLIEARLPHSTIKDNPLLNSIINNNLGSQFVRHGKDVECLNINKQFQSINKGNKIVNNLFLLGLPTEGIKFYTFILPRPYICSTFLKDSYMAVNTLLEGNI